MFLLAALTNSILRTDSPNSLKSTNNFSRSYRLTKESRSPSKMYTLKSPNFSIPHQTYWKISSNFFRNQLPKQKPKRQPEQQPKKLLSVTFVVIHMAPPVQLRRRRLPGQARKCLLWGNSTHQVRARRAKSVEHPIKAPLAPEINLRLEMQLLVATYRGTEWVVCNLATRTR